MTSNAGAQRIIEPKNLGFATKTDEKSGDTVKDAEKAEDKGGDTSKDDAAKDESKDAPKGEPGDEAKDAPIGDTENPPPWARLRTRMYRSRPSRQRPR